MAKKLEKNIITGLDIGTSKVVALIGEVAADGAIEIIGILFSVPCRKLNLWLAVKSTLSMPVSQVAIFAV
jgi:cell division protein FtsA